MTFLAVQFFFQSISTYTNGCLQDNLSFKRNVGFFHCNSLAALYFAAVTTVSAIAGQHVAGKVIKNLGRASLIIFILAFTIFVSSLTLGMSHSYIRTLFPFVERVIDFSLYGERMLFFASKQVGLA